MGSRLDLQTLLEEVLGSGNVYVQPPASLRMNYDAIVYSRRSIDNSFANNNVYKQDDSYEITAIYRDPDSELPRRISLLPRCRFDRHFIVDNLNHDVFTIYY